MHSPNREIHMFLEKSLSALPGDINREVWLAIGDFDQLKDVNTLFGKTVVDVLLNLSSRLMNEVIKRFCGRFEIEKEKHAFIGDELTLVISHSSLGAQQMRLLLDDIRESVFNRFTGRFIAPCFLNFEIAAQVLQPSRLFEIKRLLAGENIYIDTVPRKRGHLAVAPLIHGNESAREALTRVKYAIDTILCPEIGEEINGTFSWLYDGEKKSYEVFNEGFTWPLTMSFGAVSSRALSRRGDSSAMAWGGDIPGLAHQMFFHAQENLKESKKGGNKATINLIGGSSEPGCRVEKEKNGFEITILKPYNPARGQMRIRGEHMFREIVHHLCKCDNRGLLVSIEPLYGIESDKSGFDSAAGIQYTEPLLGMKELNDRYGYETGDKVISLLESIIVDLMRRRLARLRTKVRNLCISRFVDSFKIYFFSDPISRERLIEVMKDLVKEFNTSSPELRLSRLSVSLVYNREKIAGNTLFRRLELTEESPQHAEAFRESHAVIVKEYAPDVERDGEDMKERKAYASALSLIRNSGRLANLERSQYGNSNRR